MGRVLPPVKHDVPANPRRIGRLRAPTVPGLAERPADDLHESKPACRVRRGQEMRKRNRRIRHVGVDGSGGKPREAPSYARRAARASSFPRTDQQKSRPRRGFDTIRRPSGLLVHRLHRGANLRSTRLVEDPVQPLHYPLDIRQDLVDRRRVGTLLVPRDHDVDQARRERRQRR